MINKEKINPLPIHIWRLIFEFDIELHWFFCDQSRWAKKWVIS